MKKLQILLVSVLVVLTCDVYGQDKVYKYSLSSEILGTTNGEIPFWLRTNKFGAIPVSGVSATIRAQAYKIYDKEKDFDWSYGLNGQAIAGRKSKLTLVEAFITTRYKGLELRVGRSKDIIGIQDSTLSSGSFSVSGNALGIPKVELSMPEYVSLPIFDKFIAIKGKFSYGIMGTEPISKRSYIFNNEAFTQIHQKSFYVQLGRTDSKLKLSGGFNHNVQWGDERNFFTNWGLSNLSTAFKAVTGGTHKQSKVGNHGGSIDQKIEYRLKNTTIEAYHQFFYEVGGLAHLNNIKDGLFGVVLKNHKVDVDKFSSSQSSFKWNKFLIEVFASKSQGGELDAPPSPSGDEDYYNNYLYLNGWRYKGENIGNNFITNKKYIRKELPSRPHESHGNNRIYLLHLGADVNVGNINVISMLSFSRNFGTYATSPIGNATGGVREIFPGPFFYPVSQFSGFLQLNKQLKNNLKVGVILAGDKGELLYNSFGAGVSLTKYW
jgi:hypothetical protein